MKRNLLLLIVFIVSLGTISAQTTIWSSDCEDLTGWSGEDNDGDGSNWFYYSGGETFGFQSGRFYGSPSSSMTPDNALFTPAFFIPNDANDIKLNVRVASSSATNYLESYAVYIQEVGVGSPYDTMLFQQTLSQGGPASANDIEITIPNNFANKSVKLIFRHYNCSNQDYLLLDDFRVEYTNTLSTVDNEFNDFSIFPNPVVNELSFKTSQPISSVEIYNILGEQVAKANTNRIINNKIDVSNLTIGNYLVRVKINDVSKTYKFIKK
ncbi:T9SS type A sorting domain-containing protein [Hanstruepera ponticola]|uniref:T9SS type A sorting domain-containing protein n=1 Tax=Hanstruepera ponticola TaxID=2042995 RepID=UPI000CF149BC|nr:T9SS type A sorting domain-containing protein [Hanstruepera ponticola]